MHTFDLNQLRLARLIQNGKVHIVTLLGYDRQEKKAICCKYSMEKKNLQLSKVQLDDLLIFDIHFMNNIISNEDDSNDIKGGLYYLMEIGLDEKNWNSDWFIFNWNKIK